MSRLILIELKLLLRGWAVQAGLVMILAAGVLGLFHGRGVITRQQSAMARPEIQNEEHRAILSPLPQTLEAGSSYATCSSTRCRSRRRGRRWRLASVTCSRST